LNETHQFLVYADNVYVYSENINLLVFVDNVYMLSENINTINKNTEALLVASKEAHLEVNREKTKYMFINHHGNAGRSLDIMIPNKFFENVAKLRYFGTIVTNQNCIHEEIRTVGNACYHSVQNFFVFPSV